MIKEKFIKEILIEEFSEAYHDIYSSSHLIQYIDKKTGAIHGNSKTRRSLGNIYAIYSILHFYTIDFRNQSERYKSFHGYSFSQLLEFCRSQYGGEKMQNHALNSRFNSEFANKIGKELPPPIIIEDGKYLIHIDYIIVKGYDLSETICRIIEKYIELIKEKDSQLTIWLNLLTESNAHRDKKEILKSLLTEDSEARIFEIISYAILKHHYRGIKVYFGPDKDDIREEELVLYKTGRTNANDGGIDFVMKPLGRFFQVTEVDHYDKYLLDIDKVLHYPVTFVIKTTKSKEEISDELEKYISRKSGGMEVLINRYRHAIEEVITINELIKWLFEMRDEQLSSVIDDINTYYKFEMNVF